MKLKKLILPLKPNKRKVLTTLFFVAVLAVALFLTFTFAKTVTPATRTFAWILGVLLVLSVYGRLSFWEEMRK